MTRPGAAFATPWTAQRASAACAFVVSAAMIIIAILTVGFGPVPQSPSELRAWSQAAQFPLALLNETVVIGAGLLVPVVLALWRVWAARDKASVGIGLGLLGAVVPLTWTVGLVQGRLVYPIGTLAITDPAALALITTLWLGGAHMISLVLTAATTCLGCALVRTRRLRWLGVVAFAAAASQFLLAYAWLLPSAASAALLLPMCVFFAGVGVDLLQGRPESFTVPASA
ncbi:MAG: hypothetical protein ACOH2F_18855 [Cellulomonas sp.]